MRTIKCIKKYYIKNSTPGIGRVTFDINLDIRKHINEINMALWLRDTFGGNIKIMEEKDNENNKSQPDYLWNNYFWELKNCSSLRSVDNRLHKAIHQIRRKNNSGGVILNIYNKNNTYNEILSTIYQRLNYSRKDKFIVIVIINNELIEVLEIKKSTTKVRTVPR